MMERHTQAIIILIFMISAKISGLNSMIFKLQWNLKIMFRAGLWWDWKGKCLYDNL